MHVRRVLLASLLFSCLFLTSCAKGNGNSNTAPSYTAIEGNWHIAGESGSDLFTLAQSPLLTLSIGVSGNAIYASSTVGVTCSSGAEIGGGSGMSLTGQIASDGTFMLSNSAEPLDSIQVTIKGTAPADGATTWTGSYTVVNAATETSCLFNNSATFTATSYSPLDGTYAGTITGPNLGSGWTVSVQMSQGALTSAPLSSNSSTLVYFTPLTSTITIGGSSTLTSGTTTANPLAWASAISGNSFIVNYIMNDGSTLALDGWFTDSSESTLQVEISSFGGSIGASNICTLTRQ